MRKRIDFECPNCKNKSRITINDEYNESNITDLLTRDIFKVNCKKCNNTVILDYPFKLKTDRFSIGYNIDTNVKRKVKTFDDFKEKTLIFNDDLNDILVELLKKKIETEVSEELELRYDGSNEEKLIFYSVLKEESYGINKELYEYYLSKYKIEDNNILEIDSSNYYKYIK